MVKIETLFLKVDDMKTPFNSFEDVSLFDFGLSTDEINKTKIIVFCKDSRARFLKVLNNVGAC